MNALSICILHSKILTSIMISGCLAWFWLDASLLSSGYDHRWYGATQQAIYVASVEEMAYIGGTWVKTVMWPVMMQTILISNVQEKKWRRLAGLLGGWWQHKSRMEISCYAYWFTSWIIYLWLIPHWQHCLLQSCNLMLQRSLYSHCFIWCCNQSIHS